VRKDLFARGQEVWLLLAVLTLAVFMLELSTLFRSSVGDLIQSQSRGFLTADLQVTSLSPIDPGQIQEIQGLVHPTAQSLGASMYTHALVREATELVDLKAVDDNYPLVGHLTFNNGKSLKECLNSHGAAVDADLAQDLHLQVGDPIQFGHNTLTICSFVTKDAGAFRFNLMQALPVYISMEDFRQTGLLQPGAQVYYQSFFLTPPLPESALQSLSKKDYFVRTAKESVGAIERGLRLASQVLNLALLFVVSLCFVISFYGFQTLIHRRLDIFAILDTFGATRREISIYGLGLAVSIVVVSFIAATALSGLLVLFFHLSLPLRSLLELAAVFLCQSFCLWIPQILILRTVRPVQLLRKSGLQALTNLRQDYIHVGFGLICSAVLASLLLRDLHLLLGFVSTLLVSALISLAVLPWVCGWLSALSWVPGRVARMSLRNLRRVSTPSTLLFQSFFLGLLTQTVLIHLSSSIRAELNPARDDLPQFFVTNVRREDLDPLKALVESQGGHLDHPSPLFLARLLKINDKEVTSESFQKFPLRMTEAEGLKDSEHIDDGRVLRKTADAKGVFDISVEVEYARRNNLHLGDLLEFELEGLPLFGRIEQLRKIEWAKFEPNFFIQFPKGALTDYPSSWIATIKDMRLDRLPDFKHRLSTDIPASLFDIRRILTKFGEILTTVERPVQAALFSVVGICALLCLLLLAHHTGQRSRELAILEVCGASRSQKRRYLFFEYFFILMMSLCASEWVAWVLCRLITKSILAIELVPDFQTAFFCGIATAALVLCPLIFLVGRRSRMPADDLF
jgi:putative ABC transport system permease protein